MDQSLTVLLAHRLPPENGGTPSELKRKIESKLDQVELICSNDHQETVSHIQDADVLIEHGYDTQLFEYAEDLQWIQSLSAGYDRYDLEYLREHDIVLTTVSGVHAKPVADHVMGSVLLFERGLHRAIRRQNSSEWRRWQPDELSGKTLAVIGAGSIGTEIARRAKAFGMDVVGTKRDPSTGGEDLDEVYGPGSFHTVLGISDHVVATCPLTDKTRNLFDGQAFGSMDSDAIFVNVSRGDVVEQEALTRALQNAAIKGAVLDVAKEEPLPPNSPLWDLSNVLITPHLAGGSPRYIDRVAELFATNYSFFIAGEKDEMGNRVV